MHEKVLTRSDSPRVFLERLDARIKIVCLLVWAVCVVTIPQQYKVVHFAYALVLLALLILNHRSLGKFARRFGAALPFVVLVAVLLPFFGEGAVLWHLGPIAITQEGLWAAERVVIRAVLCVAAVCLVWATTPEPELIAGLRGVGLPAMLVGVIAFMLRYLHVLRPELHRLWDARAARTIGFRNGASFRSAGNLLGAFFLRSHDRAVRVADAMAARGYDGRWRTAQQVPLTTRDALAGAAFSAGIGLLRCFPWH